MTSETATKRAGHKGADLRPDTTNKNRGVTRRAWFWVGAFPTLPRGHLLIGGTTFGQNTEEVKPRVGTEPSKRIPRIGQVMHLSKIQVDAIKEDLRRSIVRFTDPPRKDQILGPGEGIEALDYENNPPRRGHPVRILPDDEIQERRKNGYPASEYTPADWDEALSDHLFAVPCENQKRPRVGVEYPESLSITGLEWPGKMQE